MDPIESGQEAEVGPKYTTCAAYCKSKPSCEEPPVGEAEKDRLPTPAAVVDAGHTVTEVENPGYTPPAN